MYIIKSIKTCTTQDEKHNCDYYDAEAIITITDEYGKGIEDKYILVHQDALAYKFVYSCSNDSLFDTIVKSPEQELNGIFIEKFEYLEDATESEFIDLYIMLNGILDAMSNGPLKPITTKAKLIDLKSKADVVEDENADEQYYFAVIQTLEYGNETYEITFSIENDEISIVLRNDNKVLEKFEDLQDAGGSEWFILYCKLKDELLKVIYQYGKDHRDTVLNIAWVTHDLEKDWIH